MDLEKHATECRPTQRYLFLVAATAKRAAPVPFVEQTAMSLFSAAAKQDLDCGIEVLAVKAREVADSDTVKSVIKEIIGQDAPEPPVESADNTEAMNKLLRDGPPAIHIEGYSIGQWCPPGAADAPPTAVTLMFHIQGSDAPLVIRFKAARALDALIGTLTKNRFEVWPEKE